ncbi:unnamed protein product [Durusdinium trenchii]|uniref:Uncharacterized protein n=2 Tax=Durusdinium trenchii TaxID=1381693 RepID=A0ABP0HUW2_9DINO
MDAPLEDSELLSESPQEVVAPRARGKYIWPLFALLVVAALALVLPLPRPVSWGSLELTGLSTTKDNVCGTMTCMADDLCCGHKVCCTADSKCCGGVCLSAGSTCCRDNEHAPLMCTPDTFCCGKDSSTALCCTTGCSKSLFGTSMCKDPK